MNVLSCLLSKICKIQSQKMGYTHDENIRQV